MVSREDYISLERQVLKNLEFDLTFNSPITFLERYLRIYQFDDTSKPQIYAQISSAAYKCCRVIQRESSYLESTPSQIAAASLVLSYNLVSQGSMLNSKQSLKMQYYIGSRLRSVGLLSDLRFFGSEYGLWTPEI